MLQCLQHATRAQMQTSMYCAKAESITPARKNTEGPCSELNIVAFQAFLHSTAADLLRTPTAITHTLPFV